MNQANPLLLGLIAGGAIFLGLPIARLRAPLPRLRVVLNAFATGVLMFLLWDVLAHAFDPVDAALTRLHAGSGSLLDCAGWAALLLGMLALGLMSLTYYNRFLASRSAAAATAEAEGGWFSMLSSSHQTAFLIAVGIGLHNFAEGLAIGQSAAVGAVGLSTVLVVGFALHNATEGFGISAPMAAASEPPAWRYLAGLGILGGGPTVLGAMIGAQFTSEVMSVAFLALAAGSILYVVLQLLAVAFRQRQPVILAWGVLAGLAAGFLTDMVVTASGG